VFKMYDEVAKDYDNYFAKPADDYELDVKRLINHCSYDINTKIKVLDMGCGTGSHAEVLLKSTNWDVLCFDISNEMIEQCKRKLSDYGARVEFATDYSELFKYKVHYAYSLFFVPNHINRAEDVHKFINSVGDILVDGGVFVLDAYNPDRVALDPPRSYKREDGGLIKTAHVSRCDLSQSETYLIRYEVLDQNKNKEINSEIRITPWTYDHFLGRGHFKLISVLGLDFDEASGDEYQQVLILEKLNG